MKGLLIKDFKLLKGQKNFFMTITAISIIMIIVSPGTSFPIGFLGFVGALFSLSSISYDEFDNGNAFLFSLPITRKDYVLEKYIFGLISGIMFLLLGTVISLVVIGITKTGSFNEFGLRHQAVADKNSGLPIDFVDPTEGNFSLTESVAVIDKGDKTNAKAMDMAECIIKKGRPELIKTYPNPLYDGETADKANESAYPKKFSEKLTVDLLEKHKKLSEECK